ncbi:MAG: beta-ketoacyl-ACP synthase II [Deltaproteobacteria bacterium]|nr:beta-ketoacyl-ACP synthase II [Deltaproteobacteria bacterium]MBW2384642.1 beta-ketoacyl-ACP synthase II [Deltaproteobacteria bacterium]MBW2696219.1 beta-ketoacyl-ACP synthase II [Deltaproteobacteria bacterium]
MPAAAGPTTRVVVTGIGCVSPLGANVESTWRAAIAGESGIRQITRFDAVDFACRVAGEVDAPLEPSALSAKDLRRTDRSVLMALVAAEEALADSGLALDQEDCDRIGVAIGSGIGGLGTIVENDRVLVERGPRRVSPFTIPMGIANMASGLVSLHHGLRGPNLCHVSACASGAHSIGEGTRLIQRGEADVMLVGGTEAPILEVALAGFASMKALSTHNDAPTEASRPFDRGRDGFVMGEGAGLLVLESEEHSRTRGASVLARVAGYGATADASHMVAPDPEGRGAARCIELALADAGLPPEQIGYVNAHATSTPAGDPTEVTALRRVFGSHIERLPISATKSMTGHLLGAAGALEAILSIRALRSGVLPPTINLDDPDPECELDHVANKARPAHVAAALSNSFGFGGTNATLVLTVDEL